MANYTINNLSELTGAASNDYVPLWDVSAGQTKKVTLTNIFSAVMATANTFTAMQTIAPTGTTTVALSLDAPAGSTAQALRIRLNGVAAILAIPAGPGPVVSLQPVDNGNNIAGSYLVLGNNTNATKPGAGFVRFYNRAGTIYRVWVDNAAQLRIHTADPIYDNDVLGTVVGTQTSSLDAKNVVGDPVSKDDALRNVIEAANAVKRFTYKNGSFNGEEFSGLIVDYAPRYGMDRDAGHPHGKSLNTVNAIGDLMLAVSALAERVDKHG